MMSESTNNLHLSAKDIDLIESALHTQKKILIVQSEAGGSGARRKLTELTYLMKRIGRARPRKGDARQSWSDRMRGWFCADASCGEAR